MEKVKKKTNKKKIISIILLFLIIVPILSYKVFVYRNYSIINEEKERVDEIKKPIENAKNIHIDHKDYDGEYLSYENIKIANKFNNLLLKSNGNSFDIYQSSKGNIFVDIGTTTNDIEKLKSVKTSCSICNSKIKQIIKDNRIVSNVDIFKYIKEYKFGKSSLLTSIDKTKEDYIVKDYLLSYESSISEFAFVEGDYQGYITSFRNNSDTKFHRYEAVLEKNNKSYFVQVVSIDESVTIEEFYDLISTVVIV